MVLHDHHHDLTLGLSFLLGAAHALEPGHGKTALLVHLSGGQRGFWHPLVMGLSTAVSHSVSLFAIAFAVHLAQHVASGDHHHETMVTTGLQWISGVLVFGVGGWMLRQALRRSAGSCCGGHHDHADEAREREAPLVPTPSVPVQDANPPLKAGIGSYSATALLGIAIGLLPCPSALAAFFSGLSTGHAAQAYAVIGLFGVGIAVSLSVVGFAIRLLGNRIRWHHATSARTWALIRAGLILGIGAVHVVRLMV